jgi:hypothetical protein
MPLTVVGAGHQHREHFLLMLAAERPRVNDSARPPNSRNAIETDTPAEV